MADVSVLDVCLHGRPVGSLAHVGGERTLFAFRDDYVHDEDRAVLGLHFKDTYGELITSFRPYRVRLMPFFANLLPEGRMRAYLAERASVHPEREFFLLRALGRDLPGAVTVVPGEGEARAMEDDADDDDPGRGRDDGALRFSLAGVQLKFSALEENRRGLTIPANGIGGSWIVKLPSTEFAGLPENEYSMMTLARMVGIDVPPVRLVAVDTITNLPQGLRSFSGQSAYAIERFDRLADGRAVHMEDFAQVFGVYPEHKYGRASMRSIARVLAVESGEEDIAELIRRLVFNVLIGNADMHLKNWSLIYPDQRRARLAPAYDFVSTIPYIPDLRSALKVSRYKAFSALTEEELSHLAARALLPEKPVLETARQTVASFHEHWHRERTHLPLRAEVVREIDRHLGSLPLARR